MYGKFRLELVAADLDESIPFYTKEVKIRTIGGLRRACSEEYGDSAELKKSLEIQAEHQLFRR